MEKELEQFRNIYKNAYESVGDDSDLIVEKAGDQFYFLKKREKDYLLVGNLLSYDLNGIDTFIERYKRISTGFNYTKYDGKNPNVLKEYKTNVILSLPSTYEEWLHKRSKTAKKKIRWYQNKANKELNVYIKCLKENDITKDMVNDLLEFHKQRFINKGKDIDNSKERLNKIYNQIKNENGIVIGAFIGNDLKAGVVLIKKGNYVYNTFVSHDPAYDNYDLGIFTYIESIKYCINNGIEYYNFMWEMTDNKRMLGGELVEIYSYYLFSNKSIDYFRKKIICKIKYDLKQQIKNNKNIRSIIAGYNKIRKRKK